MTTLPDFTGMTTLLRHNRGGRVYGLGDQGAVIHQRATADDTTTPERWRLNEVRLAAAGSHDDLDTIDARIVAGTMGLVSSPLITATAETTTRSVWPVSTTRIVESRGTARSHDPPQTGLAQTISISDFKFPHLICLRLLSSSRESVRLAPTHTTSTHNENCDDVVFIFMGSKMVKKYEKPHLTFEQQLAQLQKRKLIVENPANAICALEKIGYYRLAAYWYPFRKDKPEDQRTTEFNYRYDEFKPNHSFEQAVALYDFDRRLRLLLLEALGVIEIQLRAKIAYFAGKIDGFIHLNRSLLDEEECGRVPHRNDRDSYSFWQDNYKKQLRRARSEDFIRHHMDCYGRELPIWIATEILEFGSISKLFEFLPKNVKNNIAPAFGVLQGNIMASWIRNFNYTRNIAAHHSRLWNRLMVMRIQKPNRNVVDPGIFHLADSRNPNQFKKIYPTLALIAYTLSYLELQGNWRNRLVKLLEQFPEIDGLGLQTMGFPDNWKELGLWRTDLTLVNGAAIPPWSEEVLRPQSRPTYE